MVYRIFRDFLEENAIKNRIHLGSRLDLAKIADSLDQLKNNRGVRVALTFDIADEDESWLQVTIGRISEIPAWIMDFGYPSEVEPAVQFARLSIMPPASLQITDWTPNINARLTLDLASHTLEVAEFVQAIILTLYGLGSDVDIDLALEYG